MRTGVEACHGNNFSQKLVFPQAYCNPDSNFAMPKSPPGWGSLYLLTEGLVCGVQNEEDTTMRNFVRLQLVAKATYYLGWIRAGLRGFGTL